jgi:hypothetical protein
MIKSVTISQSLRYDIHATSSWSMIMLAHHIYFLLKFSTTEFELSPGKFQGWVEAGGLMLTAG